MLAMRNPKMARELIRSTDRALSNADAIPGVSCDNVVTLSSILSSTCVISRRVSMLYVNFTMRFSCLFGNL